MVTIDDHSATAALRSTTVTAVAACRICRLATWVPSRELRNDTRGLLRRAEAGEEMVITTDGRPVARLAAVNRRSRFTGHEEFVRRFLGRRADLDELAGDTMDDLPPL